MNIGNGDPNFKIHIREYVPADLDACLSIWTSNQDVLPETPDVLSEFLQQGTSWFLVAELDEKVVACGGLEISGDVNGAHLVFGLVEKQNQRRGIGTLMTLSRLALVPTDEPTTLVSLESPVATEPFYARFGFERMRPAERRYPGTAFAYADLGLWLTPEQRAEIQKTLACCPVSFAEGIF